MATNVPRKNPSKRGEAAPKKATRPRRSAAESAVDEIAQVTQRLDAVRLRAAAGRLLAGRRKDLEAIVAANRKSFDAIQAVVKRQTELLKEQIAEWRSVGKVMSVIGPAQSIAQLDELAKAAFRLSLANVKELAELSVKKQAEAFELVHGRIRQNIAEVNALLESE